MKGRAANILIVEDNPNDVKITERAFNLSDVPKNLYVVRDGQEALDYLFRQGEYREPGKAPRPALILLDINLPKVDGIEVLRRIKSDENLKRIPVVMHTVSSRPEDVTRSYDMGVNSYVDKPVEFDACVEAIRKIESYWLSFNITAED